MYAEFVTCTFLRSKPLRLVPLKGTRIFCRKIRVINYTKSVVFFPFCGKLKKKGKDVKRFI